MNAPVTHHIHMARATKDPDIPNIGVNGKPCGKADCPGPDRWEMGFGLAGGGYGPYEYCPACGEIKGKDDEVDDHAEKTG